MTPEEFLLELIEKDRGNDRLLLSIMYSGPYEKIEAWAWTIDRRTLEIRKEIPEGSWRDRLASWAERKDHAWRERYVDQGIHPRKIWLRRTNEEN